MADVETVQRFMDFNMSGKLDEGRALLHDDFVAHEPAGLPYGGEYHGAQGFHELFGKIVEHLDLVPVEVYGVHDAGELVVVPSLLRFTARDTGRSAETAVIELFRVRDGRITELDVYYKDPGAVAALLAP